jgi:hypothetical protein
MSAATVSRVKRGDVFMPCPDPDCEGDLVFVEVTGPLYLAACDRLGCQEDRGVRPEDATRRAGGLDEDRWWDR